MTRPSKNDLVLDGNEVKLRLKAERAHAKTPVHVDWVRFTVHLKSAPLPHVDDFLPTHRGGVRFADDFDAVARVVKLLREVPDSDYAPSVQALELAGRVCVALGPGFSVFPEIRKGHDFYRCRWSIVRNGAECGWVGFLASGESPRQHAQALTMHCNLYGTACTFAEPGFNHRVADLVDELQGVLTRVDLALDFFDGLSGGLDRVKADYMAGLLDVGGRRPSCNLVGDWCNGRARSFYFGSKEAGKQTNVYEKGHQLFGPKDDSPWQRVELRYGNKLRVLPSAMLRNPADFFAGASDWHAAVLGEADAHATPEPIKTKSRLASETVLAEVRRNVRWMLDTAAPSLALAFQHLGTGKFIDEILLNKNAPGRLQKFSEAEIAAAFKRAFNSGSGGGRVGLQPAM